ncbi:FlaG/FlaF family flagellin (archaellin) [Methanomicrobium sp. W14]|uniref:type IV pilin n=1 Tax=Methanomicrobium sp. W14 TaxID=2817839 RepID=UPI001AE91DAB|nr:type IV pilin N-terminal domain-containing protein [Methanomicrobium sp. W14]MBP2134054.1 FlaG/FlaF family flagellin (archaellin) [Methanomicrobium sp. W14]
MRKFNDNAVSPVVGVMLMLVVTIIIATVVSGFAGGLVAGGCQKSPALAMDVKITNSGTWVNSGFSATVTGVSDPVRTSDLKIVTSWKKNDITGGNASIGNVLNVFEPSVASSGLNVASIAPYGFGMASVPGEPGISGSALTPGKVPERQFGNYTLSNGVSMSAQPFGGRNDGTGDCYNDSFGNLCGYGVVSDYLYTDFDSENYIDPMQAVLGCGWEKLRAGDTVSVKVVFVPSGKTIFSKDVTVLEG